MRRERRGEGRAGLHCPQGRKKRQTQSPGCSHRAGFNWLGGQQIPDGPHLGCCGHPVAPEGPEGIVGLARRGWEYGAQDRGPFTTPGWGQLSRQPSRVAGQSQGWNPAGERREWRVERGRFRNWGPSEVTQHLCCEPGAPQWDVSPAWHPNPQRRTLDCLSPCSLESHTCARARMVGGTWPMWSTPTSRGRDCSAATEPLQEACCSMGARQALAVRPASCPRSWRVCRKHSQLRGLVQNLDLLWGLQEVKPRAERRERLGQGCALEGQGLRLSA